MRAEGILQYFPNGQTKKKKTVALPFCQGVQNLKKKNFGWCYDLTVIKRFQTQTLVNKFKHFKVGKKC